MDIQVKITLPDDLANIDSEKVSRSVLEQVIAEGYREGRVNLKQVRVLLGFKSRIEAENFLYRSKAAEYTVSDLKSDLETLADLGLR